MKKVYIVHGWDGTPEEPLFVWLDQELSKMDYLVFRLEMPNPETPIIEKWLEKLEENIFLNEETILVGHSIGCQAVIRFLEKKNEKISGLLLIAPWMELDLKTIEEEGEEVVNIAKPWMETPINFESVRNNSSKIISIFSDNDPYVKISQKDLFEKELNSEIIIENNMGHFDPSSGCRELPSALRSILSF